MNIHEEVLSEIERGNRSWDSNFSDIESSNLLIEKVGFKRVTSEAKGGKRHWFCSKFQRGECNKTSPHSAKVGSENRLVEHICAVCYMKDKVCAEHPETDTACPHHA